jgi:phenylacetate-CoA ligase
MAIILESIRVNWRLDSALSGIVWPAVPAPQGAAALALLYQLERSQWLPPERIAELQMRQLCALLEHAHKHVPYYRSSWGSGFHAGASASADGLAALPLLTRRDLLQNYDKLKSERIPQQHGKTAELRTSGSTGGPVRVLKSELSQLFWNAFTLREHRWHRRDLGLKLAAIRHGVVEGTAQSWGIATTGLFATGSSANLGANTDVGEQLAWLQREEPSYLLTYPSNLAALAKLSLQRGVRLPRLREVRTQGEMLTADVRALCREAWGTSVVDIYSANEVGYLALQCPKNDHYHVQSEGVLLEVLDEHGRPCAAGETGRLVVTDLQNFATPLVRYEIGDYGERGVACNCGRGLPVLARIAGRVRNMLLTADGKRYWPLLGSRKFIEIAPVLQHQIVQKQYDMLEVRLVTAQPLDASQQRKLAEIIQSAMPSRMQLEFRYLDIIPRGKGGKFEDFICEVAIGAEQ